MGTNLVVQIDAVADALDDMAAIGEHWKRNRDKGRMPGAIRSAMILVARELIALQDMQEKDFQQRFTDLCGPPAYERNNAGQPQE